MSAKQQQKPKPTEKESDLASVKIKKTTLALVKAYKKENYTPINVFIDEAVQEKLKRLKRLK